MRWRLAAVLALFIGWLLYLDWDAVSVPAAIEGEHAWKAKLAHYFTQTGDRATYLSATVGIPLCYVRHFTNAVLNVFYHGSPLSKMSDELIEVRFDRFDGVPVKIFESKSTAGKKSRPALVYYHGGCFIWFSPDIVDSFTRRIAQDLGIVVISVDYRLAPEHAFPAAYDDSVAVADYVLREHERLGVDVRRVLVSGDSAGGNLAAAVAARFKKRLRAQVLIYPMLQAFDFRLPAYVDNSEPFVLSPQKIVKCWLLYGNLSVEYEAAFLANRHLTDDLRAKYARHVHSDLIPSHLGDVITNRTSRPAPPGDATVSAAVSGVVLDPRYAPLMADSLDDYPDAYVMTAQHDVLRDDGLMYAQRLSEARNVRVELKHYKDGFHGFIAFSDSGRTASIPQAVAAVNEMMVYLESVIGRDDDDGLSLSRAP